MDIREILKALDEKDQRLWSECRTAMRKVYLTAHNKVLGLADYEAQDDAFMDLIDIKLALLFDRGGRVNTSKTITGDDADKIEKDLYNKDQELSSILKIKFPYDISNINKIVKEESLVDNTSASNLPMNEWK